MPGRAPSVLNLQHVQIRLGFARRHQTPTVAFRTTFGIFPSAAFRKQGTRILSAARQSSRRDSLYEVDKFECGQGAGSYPQRQPSTSLRRTKTERALKDLGGFPPDDLAFSIRDSAVVHHPLVVRDQGVHCCKGGPEPSARLGMELSGPCFAFLRLRVLMPWRMCVVRLDANTVHSYPAHRQGRVIKRDGG